VKVFRKNRRLRMESISDSPSTTVPLIVARVPCDVDSSSDSPGQMDHHCIRGNRGVFVICGDVAVQRGVKGIIPATFI
jgi:hypothetical protein